MERRSLPEKWCVKTSKTTHKEITKWFNKNSQTGTRDYHTYFIGSYFHFPHFRKAHQSGTIEEGYTEISFVDFKQHILKEKILITGYKLIDSANKKAALIIGYGTLDVNPTLVNSDGTWKFMVNSTVYKKLVSAEVFDKWFEPVYVSDALTLTLGNKNIVVTITKDGIKADNKTFDVHSLEMLINPVASMEGHSVSVLDAKYKIGCSEFSLEEIKKIISAYKELQ
jgi:hypothetical protein